jgi:predicted transcriptional regulator
MPERREKRKNIDTHQAAGLILEHLISLESEGKIGQTIYGLRTKAFGNSQRDERIKYLVELLLKKGYIKSFQSGEDKTLYVITGEGRKFYHDKLKDVLDLLK